MTTAEHLRQGLILYLILAESIALHEFGHAKAADLLGDPLPRLQGRVTLNPIAHLDPIGTVLIPLVMILFSPGFALIGWGKPVQISLPNPATRIRDDILSTLAGPTMNVLIALVTSIASGLLLRFSHDTFDQAWPVLRLIIVVNCFLIAFNLIPLPPLDGSRIMRHVVKMNDETFHRLATQSWWILLILINLPIAQNWLNILAGYIAEPFGGVVTFLGT